jgi:hypothetical protein
VSEPTTSAAVLAGAWLSSAVLSLLGVEYFALVWGVGGAVFALTLTSPETRKAAIVSVLSSALAGAALGSAIAAQLGGGKQAMIALSFLVAAGAKPIVSAAIKALENRITKVGGDQ